MTPAPHVGGQIRSEDGFTLIETIVTLAILALILAMMPGTFRLGHRAWEAAGDLDASTDNAAVRSFLEQRIAEAMPLYEPTPVGFLKIAFEGQPHAVTFVAPAPSGSRGGGLYQYRIDARTGAGAFAPALWIGQSLYKLGGVREPLDERPLFTNVRNVTFRYFGRADPKSDPTWLSEWTRTDTLPDLIEMTFEQMRGNGPRAQPLIVALKMKMLP